MKAEAIVSQETEKYQPIICAICKDAKGNPKIKITQDKPEVTLDFYTDDINLIKSLVDHNWAIVPLEKKIEE